MVSTAAAIRSVLVTPRMSPKSSPCTDCGVAGESASSTPSPNSPVTTTAMALSRPISGVRVAAAIASAAAISPALPPTSSGRPASAAITSPGNIACGSDSAPYDSSLRTIQQPMAPPPTPSRTTSTSARRMISPLHGSASQCQRSVVMVVVVGGEEHALARARDRDYGTAIGGRERLASERLIGRSKRDLAPVQAEDEIPLARLLDVVRGDQEAMAVAREIRQQPLEQLGTDGVESRERFVQQQQLRVLDQRTRDEDTLPLAAGEAAERAVCQLLHADGGERFKGLAPLAPTGAPVPREARDGPHRRDVEGGHREVESGALGLGDERAAGIQLEPTVQRGKLAEECAEQRGLAPAVRAEDGDPVAGQDVERHIGEDRRSAVAGGEVVNRREWLHRVQLPARFPLVKPRIIGYVFAPATREQPQAVGRAPARASARAEPGRTR